MLGKKLKDLAMGRFEDEAADLAGDVTHAVVRDVLKSRLWKQNMSGKKRGVKKRKTML